MESCFTDAETYIGCYAKMVAANDTGLPLGSTVGKVDVANESVTGYDVTAYSKAKNPTPHTFSIKHSGAGDSRTCAPAGKGGCGNDIGTSSW
jgi:hypothetical protein